MKFNTKKDRDFFLEKNMKKDDIGVYAIVSYEGKTHSVYFSKHEMEDGLFFLEGPNQLFRMSIPKDISIDEYIDEYIEEFYEEEYVEELIDNCQYESFKEELKAFIYDGYFFEIDTPQTAPFLPEVLDDLTIISEEYCLWYMLNVETKEIGEMEIL